MSELLRIADQQNPTVAANDGKLRRSPCKKIVQLLLKPIIKTARKMLLDKFAKSNILQMKFTIPNKKIRNISQLDIIGPWIDTFFFPNNKTIPIHYINFGICSTDLLRDTTSEI